MKQLHEINIQVSATPQQLKAHIKRNQTLIFNKNGSIRKKRAQMKLFSDETTKLLQKKLIPKNESAYLHPNFNPEYTDPHIKQLHQQKQAIHEMISKIKQQIATQISKQQPEIANELKRKQAIRMNLQKQIKSVQKQKQLVELQLNKNKEKLQYFKYNSICLKQIQQNQMQLQRVKKQIKEYQSDIKLWASQELQMAVFEQKIQDQLISFEGKNDQTNVIQKQEIQQAMQEIKQIMENKKIIQRQYLSKKQELQKYIKQELQKRNKVQNFLRSIDNDIMQMKLQKKRKQIAVRSKSMPQIIKVKDAPKKQTKQQDNSFPSLLLTQPRQLNLKKINNNQHLVLPDKQDNLKTVIIGEWKQENLIDDDVIANKNISRAVLLKIRTRSKKIVAIGATYIDKIGVEILGRSNIWKISYDNDKLQDDEQQYNIDLDEIACIYYSSSKINGITPIGLKFFTNSSKPTIKLGQSINQQQMSCIDLKDKVIRSIQFTLDKNFKQVSGIKLAIKQIKSVSDSIVRQEKPEEQNNQYSLQKNQNEKKQQSMLNKWMSTTSEANLTKKVFVKSYKKLKKLEQIPQVDHRLMLNRKKKIV